MRHTKQRRKKDDNMKTVSQEVSNSRAPNYRTPQTKRIHCTNAANEVQIEIYWKQRQRQRDHHTADVSNGPNDRCRFCCSFGVGVCHACCCIAAGQHNIFNVIIRCRWTNIVRHTPSIRLYTLCAYIFQHRPRLMMILRYAHLKYVHVGMLLSLPKSSPSIIFQ